jgi:hypothetical protein
MEISKMRLHGRFVHPYPRAVAAEVSRGAQVVLVLFLLLVLAIETVENEEEDDLKVRFLSDPFHLGVKTPLAENRSSANLFSS